MMVVLFKNEPYPDRNEAEYQAAVQEMRGIVTKMPGFISIKAYTAEDGEPLEIIRFETEETLEAWRTQPRHRKTQQRGREAFYQRYRVQVCRGIRDYEWLQEDGRGIRREIVKEQKDTLGAKELALMVDKDLGLTSAALEKASIAPPEKSHLRKVAEDFLAMARAYHADAAHFRERGELAKALANVNYAHAWLDAGARAGLFDVGGDDRLFTLAE